MVFDESFITMKLIWHSYVVLSLGNCAHETSTEIGLNCAAKKLHVHLWTMLVPGSFSAGTN